MILLRFRHIMLQVYIMTLPGLGHEFPRCDELSFRSAFSMNFQCVVSVRHIQFCLNSVHDTILRQVRGFWFGEVEQPHRNTVSTFLRCPDV